MGYVKAADRAPGRCSRCPGRIDAAGTRTMCSRCADNRANAEARRRGHVELDIVYRRDRFRVGAPRKDVRLVALKDDADAWTAFARQHRMSLSALAREAIRIYIETCEEVELCAQAS